MQTIEEAPPEIVEENELEHLTLAHPRSITLPAPRRSFRTLRVLFWAFLIFAVIAIGATILALPTLSVC